MCFKPISICKEWKIIRIQNLSHKTKTGLTFKTDIDLQYNSNRDLMPPEFKKTYQHI